MQPAHIVIGLLVDGDSIIYKENQAHDFVIESFLAPVMIFDCEVRGTDSLVESD